MRFLIQAYCFDDQRNYILYIKKKQLSFGCLKLEARWLVVAGNNASVEQLIKCVSCDRQPHISIYRERVTDIWLSNIRGLAQDISHQETHVLFHKKHTMYVYTNNRCIYKNPGDYIVCYISMLLYVITKFLCRLPHRRLQKLRPFSCVHGKRNTIIADHLAVCVPLERNVEYQVF